MQASNQTFAIIAGTLWGNRGAEAMLVTTIGQIRRHSPGARFKIFSYYPRKDSELCSDADIEILDCRPLSLALRIVPLAMLCAIFRIVRLRVPSALLGRQVRALRECDALLDVGGITFCDGREIFLLFNVLSLLPALLLRVPVYKLSQAMGPFNSRMNRIAARWTLGRCAKVFSRGEKTSEHLRTLGLPADKWNAASDIAFAYSAEYSLTRENDELVQQLDAQLERLRADGRRVVSIVPSSLLYKKCDQYVAKLAGLIRELLRADLHVVLLPNATRAGVEKARNNDLVVIEQIVGMLGEGERQHVTAVTFDVNTASIRQLLRHSELVVTSRFHGMVAALHATIPVVVIGWSHKYSEVLAQFGCDELGLDQAATADEIAAVALQALSDAARHRKTLQSAIGRVHHSTESQFDETVRDLNARSQQASRSRQATKKAWACGVTKAHRSH